MAKVDKDPIRLPCLTSDKIKAGAFFKLRYTFPDVDHPIYGKATGLSGELKFLLPHGVFPRSNYFDMTRAEQENILAKTICRVRHLHEDLDDEQVRVKFSEFIGAGALCYPRLDANSVQFEVIVDHVTTAFKADDMFDDANSYPSEMGTKWLYKKYHIWESLFSGNLDAMQDLAFGMPNFEKEIEAFGKSAKKVQQVCPSVDQQHCFREVFKSFEAIILTLLPGDEDFSELGQMKIRQYDAGMGTFAELGAALHNVSIPAHVRQSLLFQMFSEGVRVFGGLINDILGLAKDVRNSATNSTCVLRRVVREKISLAQSFTQESKRLQDISKDIGIAGQKLLEAFPEEGSVASLVPLWLEYCDGQIYGSIFASQVNNRYGSFQVEILPVE